MISAGSSNSTTPLPRSVPRSRQPILPGSGVTTIDPDWFHRARTALRHLSRERAELLAKSTGRRRREKLKDTLIGVLRERHDPATWSNILAEAQARSEREGL